MSVKCKTILTCDECGLINSHEKIFYMGLGETILIDAEQWQNDPGEKFPNRILCPDCSEKRNKQERINEIIDDVQIDKMNGKVTIKIKPFYFTADNDIIVEFK